MKREGRGMENEPAGRSSTQKGREEGHLKKGMAHRADRRGNHDEKKDRSCPKDNVKANTENSRKHLIS